MKRMLALTVVFLALPVAAFAATYDYVNTSGQIMTVNADNATLAEQNAVNIAPHSGVMLHTGDMSQSNTVVVNAPNTTTTTVNSGNAVTTTTYPAGTYQYVNVNGQMKTVQASNEAQALVLATDIAPHSGVMNVSTTAAVPASNTTSL